MPIDDNEFDEQFKNNGFVSFEKIEGFNNSQRWQFRYESFGTSTIQTF